MLKKNQKGSSFQAEVPQSVQALRSLVLFCTAVQNQHREAVVSTQGGF